jgi:hypothetical protein
MNRSRTSKMWMPALVAAALLFSLGCGIFDTREAESPVTSGTPWVPPTLPQLVFDNLESGLEDRNGANYYDSLSDAFTFIPLQADVDRLGSDVFADWTKAVEVAVTGVILGDATSIQVSFAKEQIRNDADFADFRVTYELIVTFTRGDTETFRGVAQLDLQRLSNGWHLIRWTDQEGVEGFSTWGYLRGISRSGT